MKNCEPVKNAEKRIADARTGRCVVYESIRVLKEILPRIPAVTTIAGPRTREQYYEIVRHQGGELALR